jgi:hypothetical protein
MGDSEFRDLSVVAAGDSFLMVTGDLFAGGKAEGRSPRALTAKISLCPWPERFLAKCKITLAPLLINILVAIKSIRNGKSIPFRQLPEQ